MNQDQIMNNLTELLTAFQNDVRKFRSSLGNIGKNDSSGKVPSSRITSSDLFDVLSEEAITNNLKLVSSDEKNVVVDRVFRIEHQTWLRFEEANTNREKFVNLMDYDQIELV